MKPLTAKELEYIVDSMSNEDLLIKQCLAAAAQSTNVAVQQICGQFIAEHTQHYQALLTLLQQHTGVAPKSVQEANQMEQVQQAQAQAAQNQQSLQSNLGSQNPLQ